MAAIGIYYGSSTDNTAYVADKLVEALNSAVADVAEVFEIGSVDVSEMADQDYIIAGCPTWNVGELQDEWENAVDDMDGLDLSGKKVAIFGLGDQYGYPDNYCDAIGMLAEKFRECGAEIVAYTDVDDSYEFDESRGVVDGKFMGLAIDEDNQNELTDDRIAQWVPKVLSAFGLS